MDPGQQKSEEIWALCIYLLLVLTLTKVAVQTGEDDVHGKKGCERSLICVGCVGWVVDLLDFVGGLK
jgi:hypothetical protein